jgi:hypothetical protein
LEAIALRHQIAVLKRSGTRRPCFRLWDRLFWVFLSWWPRCRQTLMIVEPEMVLRWCRNGWSAIWGYRSRGRWRGGRPRVSSEVRHLITQMARENTLWGAPRIHSELLMLAFAVSQGTLSRYLPAPGRRPKQSWHLSSQSSHHPRPPPVSGGALALGCDPLLIAAAGCIHVGTGQGALSPRPTRSGGCRWLQPRFHRLTRLTGRAGRSAGTSWDPVNQRITL